MARIVRTRIAEGCIGCFEKLDVLGMLVVSGIMVVWYWDVIFCRLDELDS